MSTKAELAAAARARMVVKVHYKVGERALVMTGTDGRWTTTVDGVDLDRCFGSSADAWTAGVTEAYRLDRVAAASPAGTPR